MIRHSLQQQHTAQRPLTQAPASHSLQIGLWALWTLAVAGVWYYNWHADILAQRPHNMIGLTVHCLVVGVIGLIVLTLIAMRLEPWRFLE
jgi:hypothetical protein